MSVVSQIEKTFTKKLQDYSKEFNVPFRDVQVLIFQKDDASPAELNLYVQNEFKRKLDIQEDVLELNIDFLGKSAQVQMFLGIILGAFASELSCTKQEIQVQLVARSNEDPSVCLALNKNNQFVRWIDLEKELDF